MTCRDTVGDSSWRFPSERLIIVLTILLLFPSLSFGQGKGRSRAGQEGAAHPPNSSDQDQVRTPADGQGVPGNQGGPARNRLGSGAHVGPPFRPHGWDMGQKKGWGNSDVPPGLANKGVGVRPTARGPAARPARRQHATPVPAAKPEAQRGPAAKKDDR